MINIKNIFFISYLILGLMACGPSAQKNTSSEVTNQQNITTQADPIQKGKELFTENCAQCHAIKRKVIGPPMTGVTKRRDKKWLINFIQYSQDMIKKGDTTAVRLYNEYDQIVMPPFPYLVQEDIQAILSYIEAEEKKP